jgi:hypothetical protein
MRNVVAAALLGSMLLDNAGCIANVPEAEHDTGGATRTAAPIGDDVAENVGEAEQPFAFLPAIIAALITAGVGGAVAYGIAYKGWQMPQHGSPPPWPSCPPPDRYEPPPDPPAPSWLSVPLPQR